MFHFQLYIYAESSDFTSNVILSKSTGQHVIIAKKLFSILRFFFANILCRIKWGSLCSRHNNIFGKKKIEIGLFHRQAVSKAILSRLIHEHFS